jgi:pyridoxal phosphate enzyme (YggS family)
VAGEMNLTEQIATNAGTVRDRVLEAARSARRDAESIRLVAVTKTFPAEVVRAAYDAGLREFGENRVQEFQAKLTELNPAMKMPGAQFHLIGHLQSNKVGAAADFDWIETIDSKRLAHHLDVAAGHEGKRLKVLLQIKLGEELAQEDRKTGASESAVGELAALLGTLPHLDPQGLMLIPPYTEDPEGARPFFRRLREIRGQLKAEGHGWVQELSMGMSHDFTIAIEEGATMIRVGTALFGPRPPRSAAPTLGALL